MRKVLIYLGEKTMTQTSCNCKNEMDAWGDELSNRLDRYEKRVEKLEADRDSLIAVIENQRSAIESLGDYADKISEALNLSTENIAGLVKITNKITSVVFDKRVDSGNIEVDGSKSSDV